MTSDKRNQGRGQEISESGEALTSGDRVDLADSDASSVPEFARNTAASKLDLGAQDEEPANVFDVVAYILNKTGRIAAMKLQKLVYYSQAWSLVWDEEPLFEERIEAWANGPVVVDLYRWHKGEFGVSNCARGEPNNLTAQQRETIDGVLNFYADKPSQWLSDLTHREPPWFSAREGLSPGQRGRREITHASMAEYYAGLSAE
jgi:uncharacterized phage-associated protein